MKISPLSLINQNDVNAWPLYSGRLAVFNYAIGKNGWLADFPESDLNHRFAAWDNDELVAFSILTETVPKDAELFIAVRADRLSRGYGHTLMQHVIKAGFSDLHLSRIHLKVRKWHHEAIRLYKHLGFASYSEEELTINGHKDTFVLMEMTCLKNNLR